MLNDGSCWTIIGVEAVEFTFNQGLACVPTPVTPFPVIVGLEVRGSLSLCGSAVAGSFLDRPSCRTGHLSRVISGLSSVLACVSYR